MSHMETLAEYFERTKHDAQRSLSRTKDSQNRCRQGALRRDVLIPHGTAIRRDSEGERRVHLFESLEGASCSGDCRDRHLRDSGDARQLAGIGPRADQDHDS